MGTRITDCPVIRVIDGDTLVAAVPQPDGRTKNETLRLLCLDTEESHSGTPDKPKTPWGIRVAELAAEYFREARVDLEFELDVSVEEALENLRGNYGRLLVYVHRRNPDGTTEHYHLRAMELGWSPYFQKYGFSRAYHRAFLAAERHAMANRVGIWDPSINRDGASRDYRTLLAWWELRARLIDDYRILRSRYDRARSDKLLNPRNDYSLFLKKAQIGETITVFAELSAVRHLESGEVVVDLGGSAGRKCAAFFPDPAVNKTLASLIEMRYMGVAKRSYAYLTGPTKIYQRGEERVPEVVITHMDQISDVGPDPA